MKESLLFKLQTSAVVGLFTLALFVLFFIIGDGILNKFNLKKRISRAIIYGFTFIIAILELIGMILIKVDSSFLFLRNIYSATLVIIISIFVVYLIKNKNDLKNYLGVLRKFKSISFILSIVIVLILCFLSSYWSHTDADDAYYITVSNVVLKTNQLNNNENFVTNGNYIDTNTGVRPNISNWEILISYLSSITDIHPSAMAHTFIQSFLIIISMMAIWNFVCVIIEDERKKNLFMLLFVLISLFDGGNTSSAGTFLFTRVWQGKSLIVNFSIPVLLTSIIYIYKGDVSLKRFICNLLISIASISFSPIGIYMVPISYFVFGLPHLLELVRKKDFSLLFKIFIRTVVTYIPIVLIAMFALFSFSSGATGKTYMSQEAASWTTIFKVVLKEGGYYVFLYLISLIYINKNCSYFIRKVFIGVPIILGFTFLNPFLTDIIAKRVTGVDVYWRLYWLLPINVSIAYVLMEIYYSKHFYKQISNTFICILILLVCGENIFASKRFYDSHWNIYRIPEPVILSIEKAKTKTDNPTIMFPDDFSYFARQYDTSIDVIKARNFSVSEIKFDKKHDFKWLYKEIYYDRNINNKNVLKALKKLQVDFILIHGKEKIKTKHYKIYKVSKNNNLYELIKK